MNNWSLYIVECADKSLYTGISNNVAARIEAHNSGKGAAYTNARKPVNLVYQELIGTYSEALKIEAQVKKLARSQKIALIKSSYTDDL